MNTTSASTSVTDRVNESEFFSSTLRACRDRKVSDSDLDAALERRAALAKVLRAAGGGRGGRGGVCKHADCTASETLAAARCVCSDM